MERLSGETYNSKGQGLGYSWRGCLCGGTGCCCSPCTRRRASRGRCTDREQDLAMRPRDDMTSSRYRCPRCSRYCLDACAVASLRHISCNTSGASPLIRSVRDAQQCLHIAATEHCRLEQLIYMMHLIFCEIPWPFGVRIRAPLRVYIFMMYTVTGVILFLRVL